MFWTSWSCGPAAAVEDDRRVERGIAAEELLLGQVEDLPLALVLQQRPLDEQLEGERNQLGHYLPWASVCWKARGKAA
jgi:hypothetical protein